MLTFFGFFVFIPTPTPSPIFSLCSRPCSYFSTTPPPCLRQLLPPPHILLCSLAGSPASSPFVLHLRHFRHLRRPRPPPSLLPGGSSSRLVHWAGLVSALAFPVSSACPVVGVPAQSSCATRMICSPCRFTSLPDLPKEQISAQCQVRTLDTAACKQCDHRDMQQTWGQRKGRGRKSRA